MKATGVVRRIDDLGRIVIPKEIRRNFKINEGDSIEIFVDNNGIILKKYSLLDEMAQLSKKIVDTMYKIYNKSIIITDKERVIVASIDIEDKYLDMELSNNIKSKIENRNEAFDNNGIILNSSMGLNYYFIPIIVNSDALGSVIMLENDINEADKNLLRFLTSILIKNIEE